MHSPHKKKLYISTNICETKLNRVEIGLCIDFNSKHKTQKNESENIYHDDKFITQPYFFLI